MSIVELETAIYFCEQKIRKFEKELTNIGGNAKADLIFWMDKKAGLELLMEQTIMGIDVPKKPTEINGNNTDTLR